MKGATTMADVKLTLAAHFRGQKPGDSITVEPAEAKRLIHAGTATPANVTAAKAAGVDPDTVNR